MTPWIRQFPIVRLVIFKQRIISSISCGPYNSFPITRPVIWLAPRSSVGSISGYHHKEGTAKQIFFLLSSNFFFRIHQFWRDFHHGASLSVRYPIQRPGFHCFIDVRTSWTHCQYLCMLWFDALCILPRPRDAWGPCHFVLDEWPRPHVLRGVELHWLFWKRSSKLTLTEFRFLT